MTRPWEDPIDAAAIEELAAGHTEYVRRNLSNVALAAELYALTPGRDRPDAGPALRLVAGAVDSPSSALMTGLLTWTVVTPLVGLAVKVLGLGVAIPPMFNVVIAAGLVALAVAFGRVLLRQMPPRTDAGRYLSAEAWLAADTIANSRSGPKLAALTDELVLLVAVAVQQIDASAQTPAGGADPAVPAKAVRAVALLRTMAEEAARRDTRTPNT